MILNSHNKIITKIIMEINKKKLVLVSLWVYVLDIQHPLIY